jgi:hypothetical protein
MNRSCLTNCPKRIQVFEKTHYHNVRQNLFLNNYFYDCNKKEVNVMPVKKRKRNISSKKPIKIVSAPMALNETNDFPGFDHDDNDEKVYFFFFSLICIKFLFLLKSNLENCKSSQIPARLNIIFSKRGFY